MSNRKSFKVTEEEYKQLQALKSTSPEDKKRNQVKTIKNTRIRITQMERERDFKKSQVEGKKSEEKHENYADGLKPLWFIQNEIDYINMQIEELKEQIEILENELKSED